MDMQCYIQHFLTAGKVVFFDRSGHNRIGVEYVMDFCAEEKPTIS